MRATTEPHRGHRYTGRMMHALARQYAGDLGPMLSWPWLKFWDFVRQIPYTDDGTLFFEPFHEVISRPKYLLAGIFPALDCKKKSILLAAHAHGNGMPYKLIASSENGTGEIHHVFPMVFEAGAWRNADATFPRNRYNESKPTITNGEELFP